LVLGSILLTLKEIEIEWEISMKQILLHISNKVVNCYEVNVIFPGMILFYFVEEGEYIPTRLLYGDIVSAPPILNDIQMMTDVVGLHR
jgi:hypothetical protein